MASVQGIYLALFGRPADPAGLAYFNGITNNGANLAAIDNLSGQAEYLTRFSGMTNTQIINSIYQSLFGRDGEATGVAFWLEKLNSGELTINNIAIAILDGAQGIDKATIDAKLAAANLFTTHLDLPVEQAAYNPSTMSLIKDYINTINTTKAGTAPEVDEIIQRMLTSAGQGTDEGGAGGSPGFITPGDEASYGTGDIHLLNNKQIVKTYAYADFEDGLMPAVIEIVGEVQSGNANIVLINNMEPVNALIEKELQTVTNVVAQLIPSYEGWEPGKLFINAFNKDSIITGTSENDVVVILNSNEQSHTVTGGRGNDVIVVAGIDGFSLPIVPTEPTVTTLDFEDVVGAHVVDGGANDDIIINIGGDNNTLKGGTGTDIIVSIGHAKDTIDGGNGDDFVFGGSDHGRDMPLRGGFEKTVLFAEPDFANGDQLTGGAGKDTFLYLPEGKIAASGFGDILLDGLGDLVSNGADTITDFQTGVDKISVFVDVENVIVYSESDGFESFADAVAAASAAFNPAPAADPKVASISAVGDTVSFFFAADVAGDGYLFVDDNADGCTDFTIKLQGLTELTQFGENDVQTIDVYQLIDTIGSTFDPAALSMMAV